MAALRFPCTVFTSQRAMDDYNAEDMRYGDLTESQLKSQFHLVNISARADPYTLERILPFSQPQSRFYGYRGKNESLSVQACARILFDEFRNLSSVFSCYGPYKSLIKKMITHMQKGDGAPFNDAALDKALEQQILNDHTFNSTLLLLAKALETNIDWVNSIFPTERKERLSRAVSDGKLPKFDSFKDNFNGLGITVHDTWATQISIEKLTIQNNKFQSIIKYKVQDHFGLDNGDIKNSKFLCFKLFKIWFILQHYERFKFKPFMTNITATVDITGSRYEIKK